MIYKGKILINQYVLIVLSFVFVIGTGTFLLSLPASQLTPIGLFNTFFVSVSSTCVTGLHVVPMSSFTLLGKFIILGLIQIGGLGLMTLSFAMMSFFLNFGIAARALAGHVLDVGFWGKIRHFLLFIGTITFTCELLGAFFLFPSLIKKFPLYEAIFYSIFFSISSFCNAGISPFNEELTPFTNEPMFLSIVAILVIAGSIGFFVWYDFWKFAKRLFSRHKKIHIKKVLSLHSKILLISAAFLIASGTIIFWWVEGGSLANALFNSSVLRCSGFTTIDYASVKKATIFIVLLFMFIGSSPGSTGSGIKTSTAVLFIATVFATIRSRTSVEIFKRTIPSDQVYKALTIVALSSIWYIASTFLLLITEKGMGLSSIMFESMGALSTCGLSTGITPKLSQLGKIILIINMIIGRVGSLTLIVSLRRKGDTRRYRYPEERILLG